MTDISSVSYFNTSINCTCTGSLKSAIRRDLTTIRKNRGVIFVGRLILATGDKNDTRWATLCGMLSPL